MTHYLMSVWHVDGDNGLSEAEQQQSYADTGVFNEKLKTSGHWVFAGGLHPVSTATVVRAKGDEIVTTDGPYAESKEQLGGFWVIEADDLDTALALAAEATVACRAPVEVRPFQGLA